MENSEDVYSQLQQNFVEIKMTENVLWSEA